MKINRKRKKIRERKTKQSYSIAKKGYIKIHGPRLPAPKGNSKFEILLVKIFSLKQKNKSNTSAEKNKF